ncbi:MAG TPA: nucleotide sugar dehydrogenase, partial [Solirubrobacteraceae bacterium]
MRAVVVALGKIGLPIAVQLARAGHHVVGCDIDGRVVDAVNAGRAPFPGEAHLDEFLMAVVETHHLRATTDTTAAVEEGADLVICVPPLVVDERALPDWTALDAVVEAVGAGLQPGTTVSIETTVPVGTTRQRVAPALARASGLIEEQDFFTVFSPERVFSGRVFADLETYPKLVGGLSPEGEARGVQLYDAFIAPEVRAMGGAEAAELTKLVETTYRDVNIALANEFARHADALGIDVQQVIDAANSQPFSHV